MGRLAVNSSQSGKTLLQIASIQKLILQVFDFQTTQSLIFPSFDHKLSRQSQLNLPLYPLKRIEELGKPIAEMSIKYHAPAETGILHCCDPFHKELTYRLTDPFLRVTQIRDVELNHHSKTGKVTIDVERGVSWAMMPIKEFYPVQEAVSFLVWSPFLFELSFKSITLLFQIIPVSETSFFLEVSFYYQDSIAENVLPITQNLARLHCALTLAEDLIYMEQVSNEAKQYFLASEPPSHPAMKIISLYRQLYGADISMLLQESIYLSKKLGI